MESTFIRSKTLELTWREYLSCGLFHMCRQLIVNTLLQHPPEFMRNGKSFDVGHEFRDTYETYWKTFIKDVIDQIIALGFATVEIAKDSAKRKYPRCVHPSLFSVRYEYETREFTVLNKKAFVYGGYGYNPTNGQLTSLAEKVLPKLRYLRALRESCMMMERQKENPAYYAETDLYKPETTRVASYIDYDQPGPGALAAPGAAPAVGPHGLTAAQAQEQDDLREMRTQRQVRLFEDQQALYDESLTWTARKKKGLKNVIPMPIGQKLVKIPLPTGRPDIVQLHKVIQEEVCSTLGVPRSLMIGDSMYRSDTAGVEELFRYTLLWWKSTVQDICTDLYQRLYFDAAKVKISKNIYSAKKRYQIEFNLQLSPFLDLEHLTFMYKAGIITWKHYSTAVLQNAHMPIVILPEPELEEEESEVPKKRQRLSRERLEDGT
jgi:hypothetical protein